MHSARWPQKEAVMPQVSETIPEALTPRVDAAARVVQRVR